MRRLFLRFLVVALVVPAQSQNGGPPSPIGKSAPPIEVHVTALALPSRRAFVAAVLLGSRFFSQDVRAQEPPQIKALPPTHDFLEKVIAAVGGDTAFENHPGWVDWKRSVPPSGVGPKRLLRLWVLAHFFCGGGLHCNIGPSPCLLDEYLVRMLQANWTAQGFKLLRMTEKPYRKEVEASMYRCIAEDLHRRYAGAAAGGIPEFGSASALTVAVLMGGAIRYFGLAIGVHHQLLDARPDNPAEPHDVLIAATPEDAPGVLFATHWNHGIFVNPRAPTEPAGAGLRRLTAATLAVSNVYRREYQAASPVFKWVIGHFLKGVSPAYTFIGLVEVMAPYLFHEDSVRALAAGFTRGVRAAPRDRPVPSQAA